MTSPRSRFTALIIHITAILTVAAGTIPAAHPGTLGGNTRYPVAATSTSRVKASPAPRAGGIRSDARRPAYQASPANGNSASARARPDGRRYPASQAAYEEIPAMQSVMVDGGEAPPLPPDQMPLDAQIAPAPAPAGELLPYGPLRYRDRGMGYGYGPESYGDCQGDAGWCDDACGGCGFGLGGCGFGGCGLGRCGFGSCLLGGCCLGRFFGGGSCGGQCGDCGSCDEGSCTEGMDGAVMGGGCNDCQPCDDWYPGKDLTVFGGVHGFKGPVDGGLNGNFGFHEGVNWSIPIWNRAGIGLQLGAAAAQSDFTETMAFSTDRSQFFVTTGVFRRQMCERGWQWGLVYDHLSDEFAQDFDVGQVRGELSYLFRGHELGVWFTSGISDDQPAAVLPGGVTSFEALDMYAFFYRRRLINHGEGRLWVGATGQSDPIFGGDVRVPIACDWDLTGAFNYIAGENDVATRDFPEAWSVGISLVWYVCPEGALRAGCSRYRPLLGVADNGTLVVNTVR